MILDSRMSSRRHAYMQTLIDKAKNYITPKGKVISILNYIQNPNELFSTCGAAAVKGDTTFSYDEFVENIGNEEINNGAQEELARAFKSKVFTPDEKQEIYMFIRDNSMADSSAAYSAAYSEASSAASSAEPSKSAQRSVEKKVEKKPKKPKKPSKKGGSRKKTRRNKSNRRRNKTYRR